MNKENWFNQIEEEKIYHYTKGNDLIFFLKKNDQLKLTHFGALNDCAEIEYGRKIFDKSIQTIIPEEFRNYRDRLKPFIGIQQSIRNCFTFSFSTKKDMVSLWALYAPEGGYSIEFSTERVKSSLRNYIEKYKKTERVNLSSFSHVEIEDKLHFDYCCYDEKQSVDYCRERVKSILSSIYATREMDDDIEFALQLLCIQEHVIPFFKHRSFSDEAEIRIAYSGAYLNRKAIKVNTKLRVPLFPIQDAITRVIVSPHGKTADLYNRAIVMREKSGLNFEIEKSDSTYRIY